MLAYYVQASFSVLKSRTIRFFRRSGFEELKDLLSWRSLTKGFLKGVTGV